MRGQQQGPLHGVPEEKVFAETEIAPPPYPADSTLIEFTPNGQTSNRFYIDGSSLTVNQDQIVRFILVIRTPGDVNNVRFSGLRCDTREWKDYAIARSDHTWVRDTTQSWQPIHNKNFNNFQGTLYYEFFCTNGLMSKGPVGDAKKLVRLLKNPPKKDPRIPNADLQQ